VGVALGDRVIRRNKEGGCEKGRIREEEEE